MGLLIIILIATIVGGILLGAGDGIKGFFVGGGMILFISVIIGGVILLFADIFAHPYEDVQYQYEIYGLEYKTETTQTSDGVFVLGIGGYHSGTSTNNTYYFFSVTDYGKKLEKLDGNKSNIYIKETDEEKPCLKKIVEYRKFNGFAKFMFGELSGSGNQTGYILVVPTNTIKIDYEVDI